MLPHRKRGNAISYSRINFIIEDLGVDCMQCHGDVAESRLSSDTVIPGHIECLECHDGDFARDDCTVCHYDEETIQVSPSPEYEYLFNHELHVGLDEVDCSLCHAGIEEADYASAEHMPEMESCVQCHNNTQAPQNCEFCHTQLATLRPVSNTPVWINRHDEAVRSTSEDCSVCHQPEYCQECHDGASLVKSTQGTISNVPPDARQNWNIGNNILQRNHSLNFLYTHPVEARNNPQRCQQCHDSEIFCNTCHNSPDHEQDIEPPWHGGADWGAIALGLGTGGGRHARLAKTGYITLCVVPRCKRRGSRVPPCAIWTGIPEETMI